MSNGKEINSRSTGNNVDVLTKLFILVLDNFSGFSERFQVFSTAHGKQTAQKHSISRKGQLID